MEDIISHSIVEHGINIGKTIFINTMNELTGGYSKDDQMLQIKYLKYKIKYLELKLN